MDQEAAVVFRVLGVVVIPQALHHHKAIMVVPPQKTVTEVPVVAVALVLQERPELAAEAVLVVLAQPLL